MGKKQKAPAYVLGVGMTKFIKPRGKVDYTELGFEVCILRLWRLGGTVFSFKQAIMIPSLR